MPTEKREKSIPIPRKKELGEEQPFSLRCLPQSDGSLLCKKILSEDSSSSTVETAETIYSDDPMNAYKYYNNKNTRSSGITVSIATFLVLFSGFGFGIAYFLVYVLYDFAGSDPIKIIIAMAILIAFTFIIGFILFILIKKAEKNNEMKK